MGKRKKSGPAPTKKKQHKMPTVFQCLFCNHENSVVIKLEKKMGIGQLNCKVCGQTFQSGINYLSIPADVYYDWVDACEAVQKEHIAAGGDVDSAPAPRESGTVGQAGKVGGSRLGRGSAATLAGATGSGYTEAGERDDFVVEDELDGEGDFADEIDDDD